MGVLWTHIFRRNSRKFHLSSYNFLMRKHASWTSSFQCLASSLVRRGSFQQMEVCCCRLHAPTTKLALWVPRITRFDTTTLHMQLRLFRHRNVTDVTPLSTSTLIEGWAACALTYLVPFDLGIHVFRESCLLFTPYFTSFVLQPVL